MANRRLKDNRKEIEIVDLARRTFAPLKLTKSIQTADDIDVGHFVKLFELVTGETIPGSKGCTSVREKAVICQFLINTLADDVFGIPLDHITGEGIAEGNLNCLKDLLEIFCEISDFTSRKGLSDISSICMTDELTPAKTEPDERKKKIADLSTEIQNLPPHIRELLQCLTSHATLLESYSKMCGMLGGHSEDRIKDIFTQTTPIHMTSSVTSPIAWSTLLKKTTTKEPGRKPLQDRGNMCNTATQKSTKATGLLKSAPKRVSKPKPVLGSKVRKNSTSSHSKIHGSPLSQSSQTASFLQLIEHAEKIRDRRQEIAKTIKQLESEDNMLKSTESILKKELLFLQRMRKGLVKTLRA